MIVAGKREDQPLAKVAEIDVFGAPPAVADSVTAVSTAIAKIFSGVPNPSAAQALLALQDSAQNGINFFAPKLPDVVRALSPTGPATQTLTEHLILVRDRCLLLGVISNR
jgi:hypothetical protein